MCMQRFKTALDTDKRVYYLQNLLTCVHIWYKINKMINDVL